MNYFIILFFIMNYFYELVFTQYESFTTQKIPNKIPIVLILLDSPPKR